MKANQVRAYGGSIFPIPYDIELLKAVRPPSCLDSSKIIMVRCMSIIHY